jgi:tripartite-type tricarboxylate transporter receptor subunit TctC
LNGALFQLPYDLRTDFDPVSLIVSNQLLIVSKKDLPANNLIELIAWLKANPDKAFQGQPRALRHARTVAEHFPQIFPQFLGELHDPFQVEAWGKRVCAR